MDWTTLILGTLSWSVFPPNPIAWGGALFMLCVGVIIVALITYYHRWHFLWNEWLTSLDPKKIGIMYHRRGVHHARARRRRRASHAHAAGDSRSVIRIGIVSASHFQEIFSAHGTIMIFFVAMGILFGLVNLVVPLQIGSRDVAFPFLNSRQLLALCRRCSSGQSLASHRRFLDGRLALRIRRFPRSRTVRPPVSIIGSGACRSRAWAACSLE